MIGQNNIFMIILGIAVGYLISTISISLNVQIFSSLEWMLFGALVGFAISVGWIR